MADIKKGDKVEWKSSGGKSTGKVEKVVTKPTKVAGHQAKASKDNPQVVVKSDKSGKEAVHKVDSVNKK